MVPGLMMGLKVVLLMLLMLLMLLIAAAAQRMGPIRPQHPAHRPPTPSPILLRTLLASEEHVVVRLADQPPLLRASKALQHVRVQNKPTLNKKHELSCFELARSKLKW